ncbi:uncharacterized protein TrAFT101_008570 [Trichoderma asperellum]|uniref:uncharacterized protein n=1 Tax=Trichoderma asperellum TaxID=101201 RepID=UPI003317775D|nr:hypothetical protein TrAFT101_008570 [Trichoderma asperellum]
MSLAVLLPLRVVYQHLQARKGKHEKDDTKHSKKRKRKKRKKKKNEEQKRAISVNDRPVCVLARLKQEGSRSSYHDTRPMMECKCSAILSCPGSPQILLYRETIGRFLTI